MRLPGKNINAKITQSTEAVFKLRVCDKLRATIRQNAQLKKCPAPEGRALVRIVIGAMVSRLNKGKFLQLPTMAPVNIALADIRSNFS